MSALGLTWKVEARSVDDTRVELRVGRLSTRPRKGGAKDLVSIADVGFGVSQTLPVVVALLAAGPGQMVFIEQPEIHLHPRAQVAMAALLAKAAQRGVRVVVETHSSLLRLNYSRKKGRGYESPVVVQMERTAQGEITLNERYGSEDIIKQFKGNTYWNPIISAEGMKQAEVIRNRCFLEAKLSPPGDLSVTKEIIHFFPGRPFISHLKEIIHVPGLRGNPERAYPVTAIGETFPGTFEDYAASVIAHWGELSDSNLDRLGEALAHLGLTWKVQRGL